MTPLLTVKELMAILRVSEGTISKMKKDNKIPYVQIGGRTMFHPEKIEAWLRKKENKEKVFS